MAKHSGNPEVSRKMGVSALVTFLLSVLGFYLGDRYGEAIASQPGQFFDHWGDAFTGMWPLILDRPLHLDLSATSLLIGLGMFCVVWLVWLRFVAFMGNYDMTKDTEQGGQFVSRYYMSTLLGMDESGTPLSDMRSFSLDGGVPSWTVAGTDLQNVTDWLNTAKETLQPAVGEEPTPAPGPEEPSTYDYQLLDRLKSDCDYYLGACVDFGMDMTAAQKNLWAGNIEAQVSKMRELYDKLPEKPDWLTMQDIDRYEHDMLAQRDNTAGQKESVSLSGEAKSARDSSRALDAHAPDAPTHENQR